MLEDRLLKDLAARWQADRERLPMLLRRIERLRHHLAKSHQAVRQLRRQLAIADGLDGRDPLTGLPNRRGVEQPVGRMLAGHAGMPHRLALLFVDLDGFKAVNDRLGHAAGDELLRIVAARLAAGIRRDDIVCRHGGDEFVCVLPNLDSEDRARSLASDLLRAIAQPCRVGEQWVTVQASIGVSIYPRDGGDLPALLHSADLAMYAAKARRCGVAMARSESGAG